MLVPKSGIPQSLPLLLEFLKNYYKKKYGKDEAVKRIYATTDMSKGASKTLSNAEGYETFVIPNDVGGRFQY